MPVVRPLMPAPITQVVGFADIEAWRSLGNWLVSQFRWISNWLRS